MDEHIFDSKLIAYNSGRHFFFFINGKLTAGFMSVLFVSSEVFDNPINHVKERKKKENCSVL